MNYMLNWCKENNFYKFFLIVFVLNKVVYELYRKVGFE